jgi:general secretion pathway protein G
MSSEQLRIANCGFRIGADAHAKKSSRRSRFPRFPIRNPQSAIRNGFSLVEIMIVIVIIGLLATAVTVNVRAYMIKAKQNIARQDIAVIVSALQSFWADTGRYPTADDGLAALSRKNEKTGEPYLTKEPVDPWGHAYQYLCPGRKGPFEVICLGADGREGGEGGDSDISSDDVQPLQANR